MEYGMNIQAYYKSLWANFFDEAMWPTLIYSLHRENWPWLGFTCTL